MSATNRLVGCCTCIVLALYPCPSGNISIFIAHTCESFGEDRALQKAWMKWQRAGLEDILD
jgi:hypothetical protein